MADRMARAMYSKRCFSEISVLRGQTRTQNIQNTERARCGPTRTGAHIKEPVPPLHVSQTSQHVSRFAKAAALLVVAPQQVHVVHLVLILLDHVHQMLLQVGGVHLHNRGPFSELRDMNVARRAQKQARYLQQLVGQVRLNQPVVHGDVEELVLGPLGQTQRLLKLQGND